LRGPRGIASSTLYYEQQRAPVRVFTLFLTALKQETHLAKVSTESSRETEKQKVDNKTPVSESAVKNNGVERENAKSAQESLKAKGFYEGEVDGKVLRSLAGSIRRLLKDYGWVYDLGWS
jgi:peptidoglycan hydrolase-like protein with peptidoglycan-binding domain